MKINFFLLIFFFIFSCSSKFENDMSLDNLKMEGTSYLESSKKDKILDVEKNISNIDVYSMEKIYNWSHYNLNSYNLLKNIELKSTYDKNKNKKIFEINKNIFFSRQLISFNDKIYFVDDFSNLNIVDRNLNILNKFKIHKKISSSFLIKFSLVASNNLIIISDNLGTILAYDTSNYKLLWRNDFSVPFLSNIVFDKNLIYVTNSNGKLFSFDAISGKQNWSYETGSEIIKSSDSFKISIFNNKLIFSNDMSFIYCLDLQTKSILWSLKLPFKNNYNSSNVFKLKNLVIENNFLYLSSSYGNISKINADNGILIWDNYLDTDTNFLINPSSIATINKDGFFLLFDKINGNLIYKKNITGLLNLKKNKFNLIYFYIISNKFNIISGSGNLIQINSKNFEDYTVNKTLNKIVSNVIIFDNRLYYLDLNGFLNYVE